MGCVRSRVRVAAARPWYSRAMFDFFDSNSQTMGLKTLIADVSPLLNLSTALTPQNLSTEREKFFLQKKYNPQFIYPEISVDAIEKAASQLNEVEFSPTNLEEKILQQKIEELKLEAELLLALNSENITEITKKLFRGSFSEEFQQLAKQDAEYTGTFDSLENLTGEQTVEKVQKYLLSEYDQKDWEVLASDQGDFYVRVKAPQKKILINSHINWDFTDLDGVLAHEVDGHVIRYLNSQKQELPFLKRTLPFYIKTEEGLASFLGDYCSKNGKLTLKHHALKYLAGIHAATTSFYEVFEFLMANGFTESLAFQRTFRLKRGLSDTSQPGCFAKEAIYYEGMIEVKKYLDEGGSAEKLFSGKFGLADLAEVPSSENVLLPKRLKAYLSSKKGS
jgi:hypothetical protein